MTPREKKGTIVYVFDVARPMSPNRFLMTARGEEVKV